MTGSLAKEEKTAEAGKTSNQSENYDVESVIRVASCAWNAIHCLLASYEYDLYSSWLESHFTSLKDCINKMEKDNSFTKDSAIIKFCRSIAENNKLYKELKNLNNPAEKFSQLEKIITGFKLKDLEDKVSFLMLLKEESDFTAIQKAYRDEWSFYDLINDRDFKKTYIDKAVTESANKSFKKDIDKCIKLAEQGKKAASKYLGRKGVELQAYYTETDNAYRVLNINSINYNRSEPTRMSDILQQEKDIKELNIYCNKKHEIHAHRKGKERYYEFKEGAYYEMKSTWPVKDGSEMCTMIINVSSDGITEVLKFNDEDFVLSDEILELIKQNDELYIQGLSLYDAVLEKVAYRKEPEGELDPKVDADNSLPPSINSNASTQTEVNLQHTETQTEVASQQIETKTEVNLQHTGTQTEFASQQMDELILNNQMLSEKNVELKQEMSNLKKEAVELKQEIEAGLQVINKKHHELIQENQRLQEKLETTQAEANQTIVKLEKQNSNLQDRFEKEEQKNTELQTELAQKNEELAGVLKELQGKAQELKGVYEEKRKLKEELKIVNAGKKNLEKELNQAREDAEQIMVERRQQKERLKDQLRELDQEYKVQVEIEQKIKESDRQDSDLQDTLGEERLKLNIEELENEYEEFPGDKVLTLELTKDEDKVEELRNELEREKEKCKQLLEEENEWGDELVGMLDGLEEKIRADEQRSFNNQLTGEISNESGNAPRQKKRLSKSSSVDNESYVPLREKTTLLRSLSVDSGLDSDEENCDNDLSFNISPISSIEKVAESRNVGRVSL
ncbi:trichohyalin-like [Drosophila ananassae]|uniref:trichohyalin-like n=2 Tax=Drosophila ananassae TaxID=7217 RepID=UPI001CFFE423|nr:trichohyalin-like [Drosophila ananassae]XP_044573890.1 trichohyalin-like [Drosophila ananassae]